MDLKKVVVLSLGLLMLLLTLTYGAVARATPEERRTVYGMDKFFLGLKVNIMAPYEADPGENVTVTVRAEVSGDTHVEFIHVNIYGLKNQTTEVSLADIYLSAAPHEGDYVVTIHNDTSPGLIYGTIEWKWTHEGATIAPPPAGFVVTYVRNLELEELREAYDELNATYNLELGGLQEGYDELNASYNSLLENYTKLDSKYAGELGGARNLMYVFAGTTLVSVATAAILFLRRPKKFT